MTMAVRRGNPRRAESGATRMPIRPAARRAPGAVVSPAANAAQAGAARSLPNPGLPHGDGVSGYIGARQSALPAERQALSVIAARLRGRG